MKRKVETKKLKLDKVNITKLSDLSQIKAGNLQFTTGRFCPDPDTKTVLGGLGDTNSPSRDCGDLGFVTDMI